jgi:hypothetical protein
MYDRAKLLSALIYLTPCLGGRAPLRARPDPQYSSLYFYYIFLSKAPGYEASVAEIKETSTIY